MQKKENHRTSPSWLRAQLLPKGAGNQSGAGRDSDRLNKRKNTMGCKSENVLEGV
jgi:hypothetical protein